MRALVAVGGVLLILVGVRALLQRNDYAGSSAAIVRAFPTYPGARLVSRHAGCASLTSGSGKACSAEWIWRTPRALSESNVFAWLSARLSGWSAHPVCEGFRGFQRGRAIVEVSVAARRLDLYADARGADHCADLPAG